MTELEIARNHRAITNMAGRLEAWGLDDSYKRAEFLLVNAFADGYRALEPPPPLHGPSSTAEGRAKARRIFEESRAAAVAEWDALRATSRRRSAEQGSAGTPTTPRTETTTQGD